MAAPFASIRVVGLREFLHWSDAAGRDTKKVVRDRLRKVGEIVKRDAIPMMASFEPVTAGRFGVSVRRTGLVSVERRFASKGMRPDFGAKIMNEALLPAGEKNLEEATAEMGRALDELAERY